MLGALSGCAALMERDPDVLHLLPRESDLPGWKIAAPPRRYDNTNIALRVDDESALFREYGGESLATSSYRPIGETRGRVTIEVYRMRTPVDAFGIFGRRVGKAMRMPAPSVMCDDIAVIRNGLLLRQGLHFIALVADENDAGGDLVAFARIILENIPPVKSDLPDWANLFGVGNQREGLVYYSRAPSDIPLKGGLFVRTRSINGIEYDVYYSRRSSKSSAIRDFAGLQGQGGGGFVLSSAGARQVSFKPRPDRGYVFAARWGDLVFGLVRAENLVDGNAAINILYGEVSATTTD
ncbi:MAG TPA: DUF6599 family protein [Spirochaetota bacterium]|nr:DUF6599 family protein [Spirochaetota bacterium]